LKSKGCRLLITAEDYLFLHQHLFPGDHDEHGATLKAGLVETDSEIRLLVREVHPAIDGIDYVEGKIGYRALLPTFIHRHITRCRDDRLVYLAVHNHDSDEHVGFSSVDLASHERGYPALLGIAAGMPVGALVFGNRSIAGDIWLPNGERLVLSEAVVVGQSIRRLSARPGKSSALKVDTFDRQVRAFGKIGQQHLSTAKVGVIGLGGVGSIVAEYLARLGVGHLILVDPDRIEASNLSRVVGATATDVAKKEYKTKIAARHVAEASPAPIVETIADDVAKESVAARLRTCDYLFLAADSMRARLVFNAIVQQYLVPGVQLGAKIQANDEGHLLDAMSVNRPVRPGSGCLWCNQLIDATQLALEAKTDSERKAQAYGTAEINPSVISLNAIAAAHGVNDFLFDYLGLRSDNAPLHFEHFHFLTTRSPKVLPRRDSDCSECSRGNRSRFAYGDAKSLPCISG